MNKPIYTLVRDIPDSNDTCITINLKLDDTVNDIRYIDYRDTCPPVYKQLGLGSCTANALSCIYYHNMITFGYAEVFQPSRLFLYYNTRLIKNTVEVDDGGSLREALKAMNAYGMCPEELWPYQTTAFKNRPNYHAYKFGRKHKSISYFRIPQVLPQLRQCLIDGYLFAFGMSVYNRFETETRDNGGIVTLPQENDILMGGHAVCAAGFDDEKQVFIVRNSWGDTWGDKGYFYLPYAYTTNEDLVYDLWTFRNGPEKIDNLIDHLPISKQMHCNII